MGRIIHDQTIASTHIDSHGEKLTWIELQSLFNQLDVSTPAGVMHDTSRPPAVRFLGKRLAKLSDGELAIKIDYEILDEDTFANMGGFSISFTRLTRRYGSDDPAFCVLINPRQFDFDEASKLIQSCVPSGITFDVAERIEKGDVLTTAIIAVMVFTGLQVASGFFNAMGSRLFDVIRSLRRKDQSPGPTVIQLHIILEIEKRPVSVVLVVPPEVGSSVVSTLDAAKIVETLQLLPSVSETQRVIGTLLPDGQLTLSHAIQGGETVLPLKAKMESDEQKGTTPSS